MDELKSLIKKPITSELLEKPTNSPQQLSKRQAALMTLIQRTQQRRGLPAMSAGFELQSALKNWESALKNIPDGDWLFRAYEHAADNWDWQDKRHPFTEDAVKEAYRTLVDEEKQRAASKRPCRRDDTYKCYHCLDVGYQPLYYRAHGLWYSAQRACICDATPPSHRQEFPLSMEWVRSANGEYAKREDIDKYGAPNKHFKEPHA